MGMHQKIELSQRQVVSEHLVQSMQVLQMNVLELEEYVQQQALENPMIELSEGRDEPAPPPDRRGEREWLWRSDRQNRAYYQDDGPREDSWQDLRDSGIRLTDYLLAQIVLDGCPEGERHLAETLIQSLDGDGYFREDPAEMARSLGVPQEAVLRCLGRIQQLDPAGVGARDLRECLTLQLDRAGGGSPVMRGIVAEHLEDVAKNRLPQIARAMGVSLSAVQAAVDEIRAMEPRPGNAFHDREVFSYVRPDAVVFPTENGFAARTADGGAPAIAISAEYLRMLDTATDPELRAYLREKLSRARGLAESVALRATTLQRVMDALLVRQESFFRLGRGHRSPMSLADLAADTGLHPSTVSRALRDKYLQCSWGVYPLHYFLTASVKTAGAPEPEMTAERVQELIRRMVDGEDKSSPLSDEDICRRLQQQGIPVARRTVNKYRRDMGIPGRSGRRSF